MNESEKSKMYSNQSTDPKVANYLFRTFIRIFILILLSACESNPETYIKPSGKLISYSECKQFEAFKSYSSSYVSDSISCIEYKYYVDDSILIIRHVNSGFNCCPGEIYCEIDMVEDTIFIREAEKQSICDCNCLYDLEIQLDGVRKTKYFISIIEPYCGDQEKLEFQVNLKQNPEGSYCVLRNLYPWASH
jgi:hypothetical protein